jgi:hypothetical protein
VCVYLALSPLAADLEDMGGLPEATDKVPVDDPSFLKLDQSQMPLKVSVHYAQMDHPVR